MVAISSASPQSHHLRLGTVSRMPGSHEGDIADVQASEEEARARRRAAKGKGRLEPIEEPAGSPDPAAPIEDTEATRDATKAVEDHLKRLASQERSRRANSRRNGPNVSIQPPFSDLSRSASSLIRRASSGRSSLASRSKRSSVDSEDSAYTHITRPSHSQKGSLAGVEEEEQKDGFEEVPTSSPLDTSFVEVLQPAANISHKRSGSRFVEDIDASPVSATFPNRPDLTRLPSSYSLQSITTLGTNAAGGLYSQPTAQDSSAYLTREDDLSFAAGFRQKEYKVPWYEAICCCACWGSDADDEEQAGATMPVLGGM